MLLDVTAEHLQGVDMQTNTTLPANDVAKLRATLDPSGASASMASTLYDLELASARAPSILAMFTEQLTALISARNVDEETLNSAHRLLVRLVQSSPRYFVTGYRPC